MADKEKPAKAAAGEGQKPAADKGAEAAAQKGKPAAQGKGKKDAAPKEAAAPAKPRPKDYRPRMKTHYEKVVREALKKKFDYKNPMQVPKLEKIVLNMGVGEAIADKKIMDNAVADLTKIAGQKPLVTKARKSVAQFKIRQGYPVGCKVTLRGARMYEFLDRLVSVAMPRIRDFRGISGRAFDGRGNYNMGVKEQIIFPEIEYDKIDAIRGMNITISTTAKSDAEGKALLTAFKFPFRS
jgi:large subunit ribosomal protein L5